MTEPTAEQIEMEREEAHALPISGGCFPKLWNGNHSVACDDIATALARVRIEAHAAGRDEGLEAAIAKVTEGHSCDCEKAHSCLCYSIVGDIRALRGRT